MNRPENNPGPGSKCGPYTLVRRIGEGGMGEVFEAIQTSLKRRVALKLLAKWACESQTHRERFLREGEIAARMRHPNIVEVHDVGTWGERPYIVMELLEGRPLDVVLTAERTINEARLAELMLPVLSAVAAAHDRGVVHRDLKPENIFIAELDSGMAPKVLDFGISQVMSDKKQDEYIYGTPHYMSPEQVQGKNGDARSDQYALGVVLHEMTTGQTPFDDPTLTGLLDRVSEAPYPAYQLDDASDGLRSLILRATQRDPDARFADVRDMALALAGCATPALRKYWKRSLGAPTTAPPRAAIALPTQTSLTLTPPNSPPALEETQRISRKRGGVAFAGLAVLCTVGVGAWLVFAPGPHPSLPAVVQSHATGARHDRVEPQPNEGRERPDETPEFTLPDEPAVQDPAVPVAMGMEAVDEETETPPIEHAQSARRPIPRMRQVSRMVRSVETALTSPWSSAPAAPLSHGTPVSDPWAD